MKKATRGRKTVTQKVVEALEVQTQKEMFALLVEKLGNVSKITEVVAKLETETGVKANPIAVRKMLRHGISCGQIRKGSPLHAVANTSRGRPLGYSPKAAQAATVQTEAPVLATA